MSRTTAKPAAKRRGAGRNAWMQRQLNDPFVQQAHRLGHRSRAVFKLREIDEKDHLIRPGMRVVDLGAAPGGWSQYAARRLGGGGAVIALDISPLSPLPGVVFIQGDFTEQRVADALGAALAGRPCDLVMSDMAPNMSGVKAADQARAMYLAELAAGFALRALRADGALLLKVFQGEGFDRLLNDIKSAFHRVVARKPRASRPKSREIYLVCRGVIR